MEVARAWLGLPSPQLPSEVAQVLAHPSFGPVLEWSAVPEVKLPFDALKGNTRNTDLLVSARDAHGSYLIAVEAKGHEPFGETVGDALADALERRLANPASRGIQRIEQLSLALFGTRQGRSEPSLRHLRYQLLTATAGAIHIAASQRISRVVLLIHEFRTDVTEDAKHEANSRDLGGFVRRLSRGAVSAVIPAALEEIRVEPGFTDLDVKPTFFIGKAVRNCRDQASDRLGNEEFYVDKEGRKQDSWIWDEILREEKH